MKPFFLALLLAAAPAAADAASIAPHRAIYELSLVRSGDGSSFASVKGRLAFEVQGNRCEGWTVDFRMVNQFRPDEGSIRTVDSQSTAYESADGLEMHYSHKEFVDRRLQDETKLKVSRKTPEGAGDGLIEGQGENAFVVPAGTLFPMQHQIHMMDAAAAGQSRDASVVFDGSDDTESYRAITFIGKKRVAGSNDRDSKDAAASSLSALASWPVSISYYALSAGDEAAPSYQVSFDLYENGVATGLVLDYGDFTLGGQLSSLELLAGETCENP